MLRSKVMDLNVKECVAQHGVGEVPEETLEVLLDSLLKKTTKSVALYMQISAYVYEECQTASSHGEDLYNRINNYLGDHLRVLAAEGLTTADSEVLAFYVKNWESYKTAARYINGACHYLNRHWI